MARAMKAILTLCLTLWLTNVAVAQGQNRPQAPQPPGLDPFFSNPDIQKELKLSDEQINKLKDAMSKVMDKYKDDFLKLAQMAPEEQQKKMRAVSEDSNKAVSGVLDAKQWKRYKQIQWQILRVAAFQDTELQKELKLSDEQKKKIDTAFNDANKRMQEMMKNREPSPEKFQAVVTDLEKKANDVLTEEQQKNFKELKGPEFKFTTLPGGQRPTSGR